MLPDFRFLIGAVLATGMLGVAGFGLATAVRLSHEARVGPADVSRSLAFDDRADWNQFADPELARRFANLARQPDDAGTPPVSDAAAASAVVSDAPERIEPAAPIDADTHVAKVEEPAAEPDQPAAPESAPADVAVAPDVQEPAAVTPPTQESAVATLPAQESAAAAATAVADPIEPLVVADTSAPAAAEVTAPSAVEVPAAEVPGAEVPTTAPAAEPAVPEPAAPERIASISAAADEPTQSGQPGEQPVAGLIGPQLRTPLPLPRPKRMIARRAVRIKVARVAKPRPRIAAKQPAASATGYPVTNKAGYPVTNKNDPWGNDNFFR